MTVLRVPYDTVVEAHADDHQSKAGCYRSPSVMLSRIFVRVRIRGDWQVAPPVNVVVFFVKTRKTTCPQSSQITEQFGGCSSEMARTVAMTVPRKGRHATFSNGAHGRLLRIGDTNHFHRRRTKMRRASHKSLNTDSALPCTGRLPERRGNGLGRTSVSSA